MSLIRITLLCSFTTLCGCAPTTGGFEFGPSVETPVPNNPDAFSGIRFVDDQAPRVLIYILIDTARAMDVTPVSMPFVYGLGEQGANIPAWSTASWTGAAMSAHMGAPTWQTGGTPIYAPNIVSLAERSLVSDMGPSSRAFGNLPLGQTYVQDSLRFRAGSNGRVFNLSHNANPIMDLQFETFLNTSTEHYFSLNRLLTDVIDDTITEVNGFGNLGEDDVARIYLHTMDAHMPFRYEEEDLDAVCDTSTLPSWPVDDRSPVQIFDNGPFQNLPQILGTLDEEEREAFAAWLFCAEQAALHQVDRQLERLANHLASVGWNDTLWVITSDHGEQLDEHGDFGHGNSANPEESRALLILSGETLEVGSLHSPVSTQDILPTLIRSGVLPEPPEHAGYTDQLEGYALGSAPAERVHFIYSNMAGGYGTRNEEHPIPVGGAQIGVVTDRWLLIRTLAGQMTLYDWRQDPRAEVNLLELDPLQRDAEEALDFLIPLSGEAWSRAHDQANTDPWPGEIQEPIDP